MENVLAIGLLVGLVNVVKMQFPEVKGLWAFILSLGFGILLGYLHWYGVKDIEQGVLLSFVASGVYTIAVKTGGTQQGQPNI
jgi:hypothetical protein